MRITGLSEVEVILAQCRAVAIGEPTKGGNFYRIMQQEFCYPDGTTQTREYLDKKRASVVVPVTQDRCVVFVIQPIGLAEEGSLLECPAGYWDFGEGGEEAARREMAEETGFISNMIVCTGSHYQDPGSIRQKVDTYVALNCIHASEQKLDRGEYIRYVEIPIELIPTLMSYNYIKDANTFIALTRAATFLKSE